MTTTQVRRAPLGDILTLPTVMTVPEAGRMGWGFSRATAYQLAAQGEFPAPIVRVGQRYYVRSSDLLRALGLDPEALLIGARSEPVSALIAPGEGVANS